MNANQASMPWKITLEIILSGFSDLSYNQILAGCFSSLSGKS